MDILLLSRQDLHDSLLPAGNLRETLRAAHRADVIAIPKDDPAFEAELRARGWQGPIWRLTRKMDIPAVDGPVLAFCGIARSVQFLRGLEAAGVKIAARIAFPDHHRYTATDLVRLMAAAHKSAAAAVITTQKDQVRLGSLTSTLPQSAAAPDRQSPRRNRRRRQPLNGSWSGLRRLPDFAFQLAGVKQLLHAMGIVGSVRRRDSGGELTAECISPVKIVPLNPWSEPRSGMSTDCRMVSVFESDDSCHSCTVRM